MKKQNGKVVLGKNDIRLGNFILCHEKDYYKMLDVAGTWSLRVHNLTNMYTLIEVCVKGKNMEYLESVVKMLYFLSITPPDVKMIQDMYDSYNALIDRMAGTLEKVSEEEQQSILAEEQQNYQDMEMLKKEIQDNDRPQTDTQG